MEKILSYEAKYKSLKLGKYIARGKETRFVILCVSFWVITENCLCLRVCELWWVMDAVNLSWNKMTSHNDTLYTA